LKPGPERPVFRENRGLPADVDDRHRIDPTADLREVGHPPPEVDERALIGGGRVSEVTNPGYVEEGPIAPRPRFGVEDVMGLIAVSEGPKNDDPGAQDAALGEPPDRVLVDDEALGPEG